MNRINIIESDSTFNASAVTSTDIAYVPGFAWSGVDGRTVLAAGAREPRLCSTIREFEYYFGTSPARFKSRQYYPVVSAETDGFTPDAIPINMTSDNTATVWFRGEEQLIGADGSYDYTLGDADPSYVYAKNLIAAGIPVIYERLNQVADYEVNIHNYDSTQTYAKNSIVIHDNEYYIAKTASSVPAGAWTANDWLKYKGYDIYDSTNDYTVGQIAYHAATSTGITSVGYYKVATVTPSVEWTALGTTPSEDTASHATWVSGTSYKLNNVVYYNSGSAAHNYICKVENSSTTWVADEWAIYCGYKVYSSNTRYNNGDIRLVLEGALGEETPEADTYMKCAVSKSYTWTSVSEDTLSDIPMYDVTVSTFYNNVLKGENLPVNTYAVYSANSSLLDKGGYSIKYLTTGGYPNFEYIVTNAGASGSSGKLADMMALFASTRGDCVAFIDHTDKPERPLDPSNELSVYYSISTANGISNNYDSYATMITPWASYRLSDSGTSVGTYLMPGSFGYLTALGVSKRTYSTWLPISGTIRGLIPNLVSLHLNGNLTNSIADAYQIDPTAVGISINPITYINPYGYCIWGNRTLMNLTSDTAGFAVLFLNIRNTISDVKKRVFSVSQRYMFEQNSTLLWNKFRSKLCDLLDTMVASEGLRYYQVIQNEVTDKSKLSATIKLWPVYAVESFDIYINLTDEDIVVE